MTSEVRYLGALRTKATHLKSGTELITDAPIDNQGKGESFSPTDMLATSLASCMITIMGIRARDNNIDMEGATAYVEKIMTSNPRRIAEVNINLEMPEKQFSEEEKDILEEAAKGCPICSSISPELKVSLQFVWAKK